MTLAAVVVRRLLGGCCAAAVAAVLMLFAVATAPGDPASSVMGNFAANAAADADPMGRLLIERLEWLKRRVADGDFFFSMHYDGAPVLDVILDGLPTTLILCLVAMALAAPLGAACGLATSMAGRVGAAAAVAATTMLISLPTAGLAVALIWLLSQTLRLTPSAGWDEWRSVVAPALTLALPAAGYFARGVAALALAALAADHVRTARAKGLPPWRVLTQHVLWNIASPLSALVGVAFAGLLSGAVLVEALFAVPGLGKEISTAVRVRDYPVILGCMLTMMGLNLTFGVLCDLAVRLFIPTDHLAAGEPRSS